MKNSNVIGSPISQNSRNVNTFSERNFKDSLLSQNDRFVNPFSEIFFEGFIARKLSDVKSFLKYFSESPNAQTEENVKNFFKIFFFGAELRNKVTNLKAGLDASEYRTFVYPRTIKGASTAEFITLRFTRQSQKLRSSPFTMRMRRNTRKKP